MSLQKVNEEIFNIQQNPRYKLLKNKVRSAYDTDRYRKFTRRLAVLQEQKSDLTAKLAAELDVVDKFIVDKSGSGFACLFALPIAGCIFPTWAETGSFTQLRATFAEF